MVREGSSNEEIYQWIESEYGPNQVAVPRSGTLKLLSYGLPYLVIALFCWAGFWLAWEWSERGERRAAEPAGTDMTPEEEQRLDRLSRGFDDPLS